MMESKIPSREFFVVQYPGIVQNDERALETLGGIQDLTKTFNSITRRLRLNFRPDMLFAKPVYGDPTPNTALVIRAKQLRNKRTGELKVTAEIIAIVPRIYTFNAMADFQFGPFERVIQTESELDIKGPNFRVFYDELLVKEPMRVLDSHLKRDTPLYVPPLTFTRLDQPTTYCFSSRFRMNEYVELDSQTQNHPYHRKERKSYAMFINFSDPTPPTPHPGAIQAITNLGTHSRNLAHDVDKLFKKRPAWCKAGLIHSLRWKRVRECSIKIILPAYAYYMPNGPWGRVWVRFGYDPRTDPTARIYQTVDYRVRSPRLQTQLCISGRRPRAVDKEDSDFSGSDTDMDAMEFAATTLLEKPPISSSSLTAANSSSLTDNDTHRSASAKSTSAFRFNRNSWPDARQILYQLTDIDVPEVVEMLAAPVTRTTCDPQEGWMPTGHQKIIRETMTRYLERWALGEWHRTSPKKSST